MRRARGRARLLLGLFFALMSVFVWQLAELQLVQGADYLEASRRKLVRSENTPAARGSILDREGRLLAGNEARFTLTLDRRRMGEEEGETLRRLYDFAKREGLSLPAELPEDGLPLLEGLTPAQASSLREYDLRGLDFVATASRRYETAAAVHLLGRVGSIAEEEWEDYRAAGYTLASKVGKDGLERAYEAFLHGTPGKLRREYDTAGRLQSESVLQAPVPGATLRLNLDLSLQEDCEGLLAAELARMDKAGGAAFALMDVNDGGVLALGSYPSFAREGFSQQYTQLQSDPLRPLFDRSLQGLYAPGSTFKPLIAIAGLEEGLITPETKILDTGRYTYYRSPQPRCWLHRQTGETHGAENVAEALRDSCNIFFYDLGRRLGIERIGDYAARFGLGQTTGIELAGEAVGVVAGPAYSESLGLPWYDGSTLSAAIGQENNRFTPLQLCSYIASLANGGTRYRARLVDEVRSEAGELLQASTPEILSQQAIAPAALAAVKEGMLAVTQSASAAPYFKNLPVAVCAKTGSAQVTGEAEANAVFVAFAPADRPQVALCIVVEQGGSGAALSRLAAGMLASYFS